MTLQQVPIPKDWTDNDRWICVARHLDALVHAFHAWCVQCPKTGIPVGEKGDPCFECPAGNRCPAWCDKTHWKKYTDFYAFENFKIVERFSGQGTTNVDAILREIYHRFEVNDESTPLPSRRGVCG